MLKAVKEKIIDNFYQYKGHIYKKIKSVSVKNPISREWEPYVAYQSEEGEIYVREENEFYKLFVEVEADSDVIAKFKTFN